MAANQESIKQVSERFNAKLETPIAAANKMTEAVARSMEIKTSELAQEIAEVTEEVANVVASVSCELDQLKSNVAEENQDVITETDNTIKEIKNNLIQVEKEAKGEFQAVRDRITLVCSQVESLQQQLLKVVQPPLPATSERNHTDHQ
jgi:hypothetical protein